ncbi:MAG: Vta1 like-domain-containing protein [Linnemannia gamsii]|nr:MAG: Vta1 like-domain-containing protein [Linnemannia gamsii]
MSVANVPEALKSITPFLQRAAQLQEREPVVSYYSNYYAAKLAIQKASKDNSCRPFIVELLVVLEEQKKDMGDNEAITSELVGYAHVENFAIKIFSKADDEDRAGQGSQKTAKNFVAAANFLELLKVFGDIDSEVEEKIKYAKWRAADIVKAIRDGRQPAPPPGANNNNAKKEQDLFDSSMTEGFDNSLNAAPTNAFSPPGDATSAGFPVNSLPMQQPPQQPAPQGGQGGAPAFPTISNFPSPPLGQSTGTFNNTNDNGSNNYNNNDINTGFNGSIGGGGLNSNNNWNQQQQPSIGGVSPNLNQQGQIPYNNPAGSPPVQHQPQQPQFPQANYNNNIIPTLPVSPIPPASQYSPYQPPAPTPGPAPVSNPYTPQPHQQQQQPGGYNSPSAPYQQHPVAAAHTPYSSAPVVVIDPAVSAQIQKHCKWTVSALTYDDIPTAIVNLEKALGLLRPYQQNK